MKTLSFRCWLAAVLSFCCGVAAFPAAAQDYSKTEILEIARDLRFTDGVAWSPAGYLIFSDVPNNRLLRYAPGGKATLARDHSNGAAGNAFDKRGVLYTAESASRRITRTEGDTVATLASKWEGKAFNSPNGIAVRRNGDVYFSDSAYGSARKTREIPHNGIYRITPKGEVALVKSFETRVNGVAFSPDDNTLYVTDTDRRLVLALDLNGRGEVKDVHEFVAIPDAIPAGLCVDKRGSVYVAAGTLRVFDRSAKELGRFNVNGEATDCTFGEADGKALFVTARSRVFRLRNPVEGVLPH